jgi:hypothetical protein
LLDRILINGNLSSPPLSMPLARSAILSCAASTSRKRLALELLPLMEALPTRKNLRGDLGEEIRGALIPNYVN